MATGKAANKANNYTTEMCSFIASNPTAFHTVDTAMKMLKEKGYIRLLEGDNWKVDLGGKYFVTRNDSSVIAFKIGKNVKKGYSFNIVASHTDSPCFKIKENGIMATDKYTRLNTEGYGGMICSSWLDKPLSIAGRVFVKTGEGIESRLVNIDRDLVLIPNVAIHMNRDINDGYKFSKQVDLIPLFAQGKNEDGLMTLLSKYLGVDRDSCVGSDLYLYNRQSPSVWGMNGEFVSSPRLDDQECVYTSLRALIDAKDNDDSICVCACFDNEEVGSGTKQGALSTFLKDVLTRVNHALGCGEEDYMRALASSFMLSADNAHAVHPNHPEHTDVNNCTYMNQGVVVKSHAGQKYTSDGMSIALLKCLAEECKVPLQYFANHSDKPGGSTLGNLSQSQVSVKSVDIGLPQLAMHSSFETAGSEDVSHMIKLMTAFYEKHYIENEKGIGWK